MLSRGPDKVSRAIAFLSEGRFSHAALCTDDATILESSGNDVVGFSRLRTIGRTKISGSWTSLRTAPAGPTDLELYRHPGLAGLAPGKFDEALLHELDASYGTDYSQMIRLAAATPDNWSRSLVAGALKLQDLHFGTDGVHGPFCSELVARVFQRLGLSLWDVDRHPSSTSPNHLAASKLLIVEGAIVRISGIEIHPPTRADLAFDDFWPGGKDPLAAAMREVRETDDSLSLKDITEGVEQAQALARKGAALLASSFVRSSTLLLTMAQAPLEMQNRTIREWIRRRCLDGAKLAPAMRELATNHQLGGGAVSKTLLEFNSFQHGILRCQYFISSMRARRLLKERPQWYFRFVGWMFRYRQRQRLRVVQRAILSTRHQTVCQAKNLS